MSQQDKRFQPFVVDEPVSASNLDVSARFGGAATMKLQAVSHIVSLDADVTAISGTMTSAAGVTLSRPFDAVLSGDCSRSMPGRSIASRAIRSMCGMIKVAWRRHRTRMALCGLDAHLRRDIGITHAEAEHEANKPFWQA
jgi:uncharacterized protein YjiS (DUF1127 family)